MAVFYDSNELSSYSLPSINFRMPMILHFRTAPFSTDSPRSPLRNFFKRDKSYIINKTKVDYIEGNQIKIASQLVSIGQSYRDEVMRVLGWVVEPMYVLVSTMLHHETCISKVSWWSNLAVACTKECGLQTDCSSIIITNKDELGMYLFLFFK